MINILILGGTAFIGRHFVSEIEKNSSYKITLCNRGVTNPDLFKNLNKIKCNRDNIDSCSEIFNEFYDFVFDFSGYNYNQMYNISRYLRHYKYIYISTMTVCGNIDLLDPGMKMYAKNKIECESFVKNYYHNYQIIRPPYVCGKFDNLDRFIEIEGEFFHKENGRPVQNFIRAEELAKLLKDKINWEITNDIIDIEGHTVNY
jgi:nucleoside-diphosphate-sugar epimerase